MTRRRASLRNCTLRECPRERIGPTVFAFLKGVVATPEGVRPCRCANTGKAFDTIALITGYLANTTFRGTRLSPGPRLRITRVNFPLSFGVNSASQFGPGLSSLATTFLSAS